MRTIDDIPEALARVQSRIRQAAQDAGREAVGIQLLAISKKVRREGVQAAYQAGQTRFGESYLAEALDKIDALRELPIEWHFIGPIQSNKTRGIAEHFAWAHSIDRIKIAERLSAQRPPGLAALQVCIQVNISGETSKSGVGPEALSGLVAAVNELPRIQLRGLMAIPAPSDTLRDQRASFRRLHDCQQRLIQQGYSLDTLSMGMSDDLEAAILEGSTLVRVGSAIFGLRE